MDVECVNQQPVRCTSTELHDHCTLNLTRENFRDVHIMFARPLSGSEM